MASRDINKIAQQAMKNAGHASNPEELQSHREKQAQMDEQRQVMLMGILSPEAKERLNRISLVKPDKARKIEDKLIGMARRGQMGGKVTDDQLTTMLEGISGEEEKKATKITFKRRNAFDSDDDDDLDDF